MQTFNIWDKFNLRWAKVIVVVILFINVASPLFAQRNGSGLTLRRLNYDEKKMHYGFQIGIFTTNLNINHSEHFAQGLDSAVAISPNRHVSFSLGFIVNRSLGNELWDIRLLPNVSFYAHSVEYFFDSDQVSGNEGGENLSEGTKELVLIENATTFFELPIMFKYKSIRRKNHRFYLIGGVTGSIGVGGKKGGEDPRNLGLNNYNFEVSYGIGYDGYMQFFNFAPEIRFSHGLVNALKSNDNIYTNNLDRITTHKVSLYLNFEG
ncbi:MAG: outer membrane beta-barrel protein [Bacteroidota bacterium]